MRIMYRAAAVLVSAAIAVAMAGIGVAGATGRARVAHAVDECKLLTDAQAKTIMGIEPFNGGEPDNGGCSWGTDPSDRRTFAYVVVNVDPKAKLLKRYGGSLRRYFDESTNVGIDNLPALGKGALSIYDPLTGPGASSGVAIVVGSNVLRIEYQPLETIKNPSPELDAVVKIAKKAVAKLKKS
jgi:hypothetical protein